MIIKTYAILKKNILLLLHSKLSSLILILGPIILMLILGAVLRNSGLTNIEANVFVLEKTPVTDGFLRELESRSFIITETTTLSECVYGVSRENKNVCIEIKKESPPSYELGQALGRIKQDSLWHTINLHVDFSRQRVVWGIIARAEAVTADYSSKMRKNTLALVKSDIDQYYKDSAERKRKLNEIDSSLLAIENGATAIKNDLDATSGSINNNLIDLETQIGDLYSILNVSQIKPISDSFYQLNTLWKSGEYASLSQKMSFFIESVGKVRRDLRTLRDTLEEGERRISYLQGTNIEEILNPFSLAYESVSDNTSSQNTQLEFLDYLFPSFLTFFILFASVVFTSLLVIRERSSHAYIRNISSNTGGLVFLFGTFLTAIIIIFFQTTSVVAIATPFLNIPVIPNILPILAVALAAICIFVSVGMIIGYFFNSEETAIIASIIFILLMILFSPLINPLEILPPEFKGIVAYTPVVLIEEILRKTAIFGASLFYSIRQLAILGILFFISTVVVGILYKIKKHHEI